MKENRIRFNVPPRGRTAMDHLARAAMEEMHISGDGYYTKECSKWLEGKTGTARCLLTTSCTHALEMAALLSDIREGDEVIMPSYTFVSTANAFVLRGARIVFVDIDPRTMNMDSTLIEEAVTDRTRAIVPVHYAGVACDMDRIMALAEKYGLCVIEDAAQGIMSSYQGRPLGSIGDFGCLSFHETKNLSMGEGGALLLRDKKYIEGAEIIREKGTDRSRFYRGAVDKYTWVSHGSSYLPSDLNAAYLYAQLEMADEINEIRMTRWQEYYDLLKPLEEKGWIELPYIPEDCIHNAHMFYMKTRDIGERGRFISFMKENGILTVFHYVPLHTAPAGKQFGRFCGEDRYTTKESERLVRLPMFMQLTKEQVVYITDKVKEFYEEKKC